MPLFSSQVIQTSSPAGRNRGLTSTYPKQVSQVLVSFQLSMVLRVWNMQLVPFKLIMSLGQGSGPAVQDPALHILVTQHSWDCCFPTLRSGSVPVLLLLNCSGRQSEIHEVLPKCSFPRKSIAAVAVTFPGCRWEGMRVCVGKGIILRMGNGER